MQHTEVVVFWLERGRAGHRRFVPVGGGAGADAAAAAAGGADAVDDPLARALALCEALRRRAAEGVAHVCVSTQIAGDATRRGVSDERPAGYDWTKRRHVGPAGRETKRAGAPVTSPPDRQDGR